MKHQEDAPVLANRCLGGPYYQIDLCAPRIAGEAQPGQFAHVQYPDFEHHLLRRPFSIYEVAPADGRLSIIYKVVGAGTAHMSALVTGQRVNLLGPLGRGFSLPPKGSTPIIVAGGYGAAATYLLAARSPVPPHVLIGGRSADDLLLVEEFRALGARVEVSTDDGSCGAHGLVTDLLTPLLDRRPPSPAVYACGPNPMLKAVAEIALARGIDAEISLDHAMCCGVGACFACVVKLKSDKPDGWEYTRTCLDGPVFRASRVVWD